MGKLAGMGKLFELVYTMWKTLYNGGNTNSDAFSFAFVKCSFHYIRSRDSLHEIIGSVTENGKIVSVIVYVKQV